MEELLSQIENALASLFGNIKLVEKALLGFEGSYVELLTILALGLLAIIPVIVPKKNRQKYRHLNQVFGIVIFIFVVFTCLGVFGMIRNFHRGLNEIGRENIIALYYLSVPLTILVTSMLFGPTFCGWICPTGSLQEFVGMFTRKWYLKRKNSGFPFSKLALGLTIAVAGVFLLWMYRLTQTRMFFIEDSSIYWSEIIIILLFILLLKQKSWDSKLRKLRNLSFIIIVIAAIAAIRITSPVHFGFSKVYDPASFLSTVIIILAALIIPRIWCRYLCPWRCAISWAAKHSVRTITFDQEKCIKCNKCDDVCEVEAVHTGIINPTECHHCMKCVDICPTEAFEIKDRWKLSEHDLKD